MTHRVRPVIPSGLCTNKKQEHFVFLGLLLQLPHEQRGWKSSWIFTFLLECNALTPSRKALFSEYNTHTAFSPFCKKHDPKAALWRGALRVLNEGLRLKQTIDFAAGRILFLNRLERGSSQQNDQRRFERRLSYPTQPFQRRRHIFFLSFFPLSLVRSFFFTPVSFLRSQKNKNIGFFSSSPSGKRKRGRKGESKNPRSVFGPKVYFATLRCDVVCIGNCCHQPLPLLPSPCPKKIIGKRTSQGLGERRRPPQKKSMRWSSK